MSQYAELHAEYEARGERITTLVSALEEAKRALGPFMEALAMHENWLGSEPEAHCLVEIDGTELIWDAFMQARAALATIEKALAAKGEK